MTSIYVIITLYCVSSDGTFIHGVFVFSHYRRNFSILYVHVHVTNVAQYPTCFYPVTHCKNIGVSTEDGHTSFVVISIEHV